MTVGQHQIYKNEIRATGSIFKKKSKKFQGRNRTIYGKKSKINQKKNKNIQEEIQYMETNDGRQHQIYKKRILLPLWKAERSRVLKTNCSNIFVPLPIPCAIFDCASFSRSKSANVLQNYQKLGQFLQICDPIRNVANIAVLIFWGKNVARANDYFFLQSWREAIYPG